LQRDERHMISHLVSPEKTAQRDRECRIIHIAVLSLISRSQLIEQAAVNTVIRPLNKLITVSSLRSDVDELVRTYLPLGRTCHVVHRRYADKCEEE
jgi:hypothetical protein